MKNLIVLVLSFMSLQSIAQNINEYEFVIVPLKFDFQSEENEYRLNTLLKFRLEEYGFKAFYNSDQSSIRFEDRCKLLNVNVINQSNLLTTKLQIVFKDCNNATVFESSVGTSKEKMRKIGYKEALEDALQSVKQLNYKYNGSQYADKVSENKNIESEPISTTEAVGTLLFAQPITNGYQIVDSAPKVVLKVFKTSNSNYFIASTESNNGILFKRGDYWVFEYYANEKLISEKLNIKF